MSFDIAWAYSLETVQYVDGDLYGATVLGGNILRINSEQGARIIWNNDYADPDKGGVFLYSVRLGDMLFFLPYMTEYIVSYNVKNGEIEKIRFNDKGKEEKIYAHVFDGCIYLFGLDTGRVWRLSDGKTALVFDNCSCTGQLMKYRHAIEDIRLLFFEVQAPVGHIFDFEKGEWVRISAQGIITDGLVMDDHIWYVDDKTLYKQSLAGERCEEILILDGNKAEISIERCSANELLLLDSTYTRQYTINVETKSISEVNYGFFSSEKINWIISLGDGRLLAVDIGSLDWMLRRGDKYALINTKDMSVSYVPIFLMDEETERKLKTKYTNIALGQNPSNSWYENEKENLSFYIYSFEQGISDGVDDN